MLRNFFTRSSNSIYNTLKATSVKTILGAIFIVVAFSSNSQIQISIGSPVDAVEGSGGDISFIVFLEGGGVNNTGSSITGSLTFTGTATNGTDYVGPAFFSIPNGVNSTTVIVTVVDDAIVEPTETVTASLSLTSIGVIVTATSTANIYDDDAGSIFISIGLPVDAVEGTSDISFDVFLEGGGLNTTGVPITGTISYVGTASSITDYVPVPVFSIPPGFNSTTINITVIDDVIVEPTEAVTPILVGAPSFGTYANTTSTAYIFDDDASALIISIGSPMDGTEGLSDVSYDVFLEGGAINTTGSPIVGTINYAGTGTPSLDFVEVSTFSIPVGASFVTHILSVIDDLNVECDETVIATISNPSIGTIGNATSTALIIDDECTQGVISIGSPVDGSEPGTSLSFEVYLEGGLVNSTGSTITGLIDFQGTAMEGTDYIAGTTIFAILDGTSSTQISLIVIDDVLVEGTETVLATISNPSVCTIGTSMETANILDDDSTSSIDLINVINMSIYPNPVSSTLNLEAEQQMKSYSIVDLNGRVMTTGKLKTNQFTLNVENLPKGFYIIRVELEDGSLATKKVLKQ